MKVQGNDVIVSQIVNNQVVTIGGAKSCELDLDCETVQRSSPVLSAGGWKKYLAKRKGWRVTLSHIVASDGVTLSSGVQMVGTSVMLSMSIRGMQNEVVQGTAIVKQWRVTAQRGGIAKGSFVFQGDGALE